MQVEETEQEQAKKKRRIDKDNELESDESQDNDKPLDEDENDYIQVRPPLIVASEELRSHCFSFMCRLLCLLLIRRED
jgi:hypothetical protein